MKENFEKSLAFVLESEGRYVDDKDDPGGETNYGIAKRSHPDEDIKNMTVERAGEIYHDEYWTPIRGDDLPAGVDYIIFDSAVNHGPKNAGIFLQKALNRWGLNLKVDGSIGPATIKAVTGHGGQAFIPEILRERDIFYRKIVACDLSQEKFFRGWQNRLSQVAVNVREFYG